MVGTTIYNVIGTYNMLDMPCVASHSFRVIKGWGTTATLRFAESGKSKFSGLDEDKALARLQLLEAVVRLDEIPSLASIGLHKLTGDLAGFWSMTINGPWRLIFTFRDGDAYDVEITDYH
jgi:toxin HigB-1